MLEDKTKKHTFQAHLDFCKQKKRALSPKVLSEGTPKNSRFLERRALELDGEADIY